MTPSESARTGLRERTRIINDTDAEIRAILRRASTEVSQVLAAQPSDYQRWYLPQLQQQISDALVRFGDEAAQAANHGQSAAWQGGMRLVDGVLTSVNINAALPVIDDAQLRAMSSFLTSKIKSVTAESANAINTQLGLVVIGAQSPFDAIKATQAQIEGATQRRATTIVHTELARAYSTANQARMLQAASSVPGLQKKWLKSGKVHPRQNHRAIHGQTVPVDQPFVLNGGELKIMHPHDPSAPAKETINCGCVAVPVVPGWRSMVKPLPDRSDNGTPLASVRRDKLARTPSAGMPDVPLIASESSVKQHPSYPAAKAGNIDAAHALVRDSLSDAAVAEIRELIGNQTPIVTAVQAIEGASNNVIPEMLALRIAERLSLPLDTGIVQINRVGHTGSSGFHRLAYPAMFDGQVQSGSRYLLVDDFVGQGGTLANLRGHIESNGGQVVGAVSLTGKPYSAKLALTDTTLNALRAKHGSSLEAWWRREFGYGFEALTESEARYLLRTPDADTVRNRIAQSREGHDSRTGP